MCKVSAVLFDLDGVLVDSKDANEVFYTRLLKEAGYPLPKRAKIDTCFHLPLWQAIEELTGLSDKDEIQRIWDLGHNPNIRAAHLLKFPRDLKKVLTKLHDKYVLAIATNSIRLGVEETFAANNIAHLFDQVISFGDYRNPKPHPEPLLLAASQLKIHPEEIVYVGDSNSDIEASQAAGMRSIFLSSNTHANADSNIQSFDKLLTAVPALSS